MTPYARSLERRKNAFTNLNDLRNVAGGGHKAVDEIIDRCLEIQESGPTTSWGIPVSLEYKQKVELLMRVVLPAYLSGDPALGDPGETLVFVNRPAKTINNNTTPVYSLPPIVGLLYNVVPVYKGVDFQIPRAGAMAVARSYAQERKISNRTLSPDEEIAILSLALARDGLKVLILQKHFDLLGHLQMETGEPNLVVLPNNYGLLNCSIDRADLFNVVDVLSTIPLHKQEVRDRSQTDEVTSDSRAAFRMDNGVYLGGLLLATLKSDWVVQLVNTCLVKGACWIAAQTAMVDKRGSHMSLHTGDVSAVSPMTVLLRSILEAMNHPDFVVKGYTQRWRDRALRLCDSTNPEESCGAPLSTQGSMLSYTLTKMKPRRWVWVHRGTDRKSGMKSQVVAIQASGSYNLADYVAGLEEEGCFGVPKGPAVLPLAYAFKVTDTWG